MSNQGTLQPEDRRLACPGFYRMPQSADGGICRIKLDLGRLGLQQMHVLAAAAENHGNGTIELTTRGNIQLRGIRKENEQKLIAALTEGRLGPVVEAGDDIRNIMVNPTAGYDRAGYAFIPAFAEKLSHLLQTSPVYRTLSPKFSFYIDGGENCAILNHINDIWLSVAEGGKFFAFGIASCPPVRAADCPALGLVPVAQGLAAITALLDCLIAARAQDRSIQRMKHLVSLQGREQISAAMQEKIPGMVCARSYLRKPASECADLGIHQTGSGGRYYVGVKPGLGRFTPQALRMAAETAGKIASISHAHATPWQGLIFPGCTRDRAEKLVAAFKNQGLVVDSSDIYARLTCCAGLPGCAAALADVQKDARRLAQIMPHFPHPLHFTACAKSCSATQAFPVTLLARQTGCYDLYYQGTGADSDSKFGQLAARNTTVEEIAAILSQPG